MQRCVYCKCTIKEDDSHFYCETAHSYGIVEGIKQSQLIMKGGRL